MALTPDDEKYVKDQKAILELEKEIEVINKTSWDAQQLLRDQIGGLESQRILDVKEKQDLIDAIKNG
jgi:hypothetical protein